jgi:hypothetical protein
MTEINKPNPISQPVATGIIYGGTKWGPEGILAELELDATDTIDGDMAENTLVALHRYHLPTDVTVVPAYPGWDINTEYFGGFAGDKRNDRLFSTVKHNLSGRFNITSVIQDTDISDMYVGYFGYPTGSSNHSARSAPTYGSLFCKKTFTFTSNILADYQDFDVRCDLVNSALMAGTPALDTGGNSEIRTGAHSTGVYVEKNYDGAGTPTGFTVFVALGSPVAHEGAVWFGKPYPNTPVYRRDGANFPLQEVWYRDNEYFSRVGVVSSKLLERASNKGTHINGSSNPTSYNDSSQVYAGTAFNVGDDGYGPNQVATFVPMICTYPTVNFTVIGYKADTSEHRYHIFSEDSSNAPGTL